MKSKALRNSLKIAIPYLLFGCVYIAFSDIFVQTISFNRDMLTELQTYKGWGFIILTALLLFILLYRYFKKLESEQKNLEESEAKWRTLVSSSPDFIALLDKDSRFLYLNKYADGFSEEKVIGNYSADFMGINFRESYKELFKVCLESRTTQRFEFEAYGNNKSTRYYEEYLVPLISKEKDITFLAIARDITDRKNFENALIENEEKYRTLIENTQEAIYIAQDGKFKYVNKSARNITGRTETEMVEHKLTEFVPEEDFDFAVEHHRQLVSGEINETQTEFRILHLNGSIIDLLVNSVLIQWENKPATLNFASDITERKQFENALRESEKKYRSLFENMSEGLAYCKMLFENGKPVNFIYLSTNPRFAYLTGLKNVEGKKVSEIIPGIQKDNPDLFEIYGRVASGGKPESFETFVPGLNDWFSVSVYSPYNEHFVAVFTIVTERKQTELALQKNRRFLADIIENNGALIFVKDLEGRYDLVNKKWETITGIPRYKALGKTDQFLFSGSDGSQFRNNDIEVIKENKIIELEEVLNTSEGKKYFISIKFPTLDENNEVTGICGVSTEFTERKLAEEALRDSEEMYRTITETMKDVVWIADLNEERFTYVSPSVYKLRGYQPDEIINQPLFDALTEESANIIKHSIEQRTKNYLSSGKFESYIDQLEQPCKDGSTVWTEVVTQIYLNEKTGHIEVYGVTRDITDRKLIQDELKESLERFRSTLDNMLEGCQILDSEWRYIYINDAAEKHNHRNKNEMIGQKYPDLWPGIESTYVYKAIKDCLEKGESYQFENEFQYPDDSIGWFDLSIQPVPEGVFILSVDITEKKKVEIEILKSREQLRALAASLEKVREEERIHLSRELHDHLGQNLTGLKMDVAYLNKHIMSATKNEAKTLVEKTEGMSVLIDEIIKNIRKISAELRPNVLDYLGLVPAIEWQFDEFRKRTELECEYSSNTEKIDLGMQINSSIFRIIQETFTNIIRHSEATKVNLNIDEQEKFIYINILDNGVGIKDDDISNIKSLGILGMKERTINFNGQLSLENVPGGGTLITLMIPKGINND